MSAPRSEMTAPFASPRQAAAFGALVLALLALPALLSALHLYSRRDAYREMPVGDGGFAFIEKQVDEERADIDLLLVGDSTLWLGVDPLILQAELSRALGRPAVVLTFAHTSPALDVDYALVRDALARRRVDTLVLETPAAGDEQDGPFVYAYHFLPYGQDPALLAGLAPESRFALYAESVLGAPRHLLSLLRDNPDYLHPVTAHNGAHPSSKGFGGGPYRPISHEPPALPPESLVYGPSSTACTACFAFDGEPLSAYQAHFVGLIGGLVRAHHTRLATLRVPRWAERASPVARQRIDWSRAFGVDATMVGVAPAALFGGMSEDEIRTLYIDSHLNTAGAELFTRTIAPALVNLVETPRHAALAP